MRVYNSFSFLSHLSRKPLTGFKLPAFVLACFSMPLMALPWENDWPISNNPASETQDKHQIIIDQMPDIIKEHSPKSLKPVPKANPHLSSAVAMPFRFSLFDTLSGKSAPLWGSFSNETTFGAQSRPVGIYVSPGILRQLQEHFAPLKSNWLYAITDRTGRPIRFLGAVGTPPESLPYVHRKNSALQIIDLPKLIPQQGEVFVGIINFTTQNPTVTAISQAQKNGTAIIPLDIVSQLKSLPKDQREQLTLVTASYNFGQPVIHGLSLPLDALSLSEGYLSRDNNHIVVTIGNAPRQLTYEKQMGYEADNDALSIAYQTPPYDPNRIEIAVRLNFSNRLIYHHRLKGLPHPAYWLAEDKFFPNRNISIPAKELVTLCANPHLCQSTLVVIEHRIPTQKTGAPEREHLVHQLSALPLERLLDGKLHPQSGDKKLSLPTIAQTLLQQPGVLEQMSPVTLQLPGLNLEWSAAAPNSHPLLDPKTVLEQHIKHPKELTQVMKDGKFLRLSNMPLQDLPQSTSQPPIQSDEQVFNDEVYESLQFSLAQKEQDKALASISSDLKLPLSEMVAAFRNYGFNLKATRHTPDPSGSPTPSNKKTKKAFGKPNQNTPSKESASPSLAASQPLPIQHQQKHNLDLPSPAFSRAHQRQVETAIKMANDLRARGMLSGKGSGGSGDPGSFGDLSNTSTSDLEDLNRHFDAHPAEQALGLVQDRITRYPLYTLASLFALTAALEIYHSWNLYPDAREVLIRKTLKAMGPGATAFQHEALRMLVEGTPEDLLEYWGSDTLSWWVTQASQQWCSRNNCSANVIPDIFLHYILSPVSIKKERFLKELRVRVSLEPLDTKNPWLRTINRRRKGLAAALDFNPVTQQYWMAKLNDHGLLQETSNLMYTTQIPVKVMRYSFLESFQVKSQHERYKELIPHPVTDATNQYRPVVPYPMERQRYGVYTCATVDGDKWRAIDINGEEPGFYGVPAIIGYAHKAVDGYCVINTLDKWLSVLGSDGQTSLLNPEYEPEQAVRLDLQNTFRKPKDELGSETCKIQYWKKRRWKTAEVTDLAPGSVEAQLPANAFYRVRCGKETATFTRDSDSGMLYVWSWPPVTPANKTKSSRRAQPAG